MVIFGILPIANCPVERKEQERKLAPQDRNFPVPKTRSWFSQVVLRVDGDGQGWEQTWTGFYPD